MVKICCHEKSLYIIRLQFKQLLQKAKCFIHMPKETPMSTAVCKLFMHEMDWFVIFHTGGRSPAQDKSTINRPIGWYIIASVFATYIFFTLDAEQGSCSHMVGSYPQNLL